MQRLCLSLALALLGITACCAPPLRTPLDRSAGTATIYVVKRSWHIDLGFGIRDLDAPLASLRAPAPTAQYLLFGFGDEHYLLTHGAASGRLSGALWPGPGVVLLTALEATPEAAFGATSVVRLEVSTQQARQLATFIWDTLTVQHGRAEPLGPGPYAGSWYFASGVRYSALHTCNTWAAEGLHAAGLPVRSRGVELSGQLWRQVRRLEPSPDLERHDR